MTKAWEWMKDHPYITAAILVGGGLLIFLMFFRSSAGANAPLDNTAALAGMAASNTASGNQLAAEQLQAQVATNAIQSDAASKASDDATAVQLAQLSSNAAITSTGINAASAKDVNDATVAIAGINAGSAVQISSIAATAAATQSYESAQSRAYDTLSAGNVANTSSTLNFITGLAKSIIGGTTPIIGTSGAINFSASPSGVLNGVSYSVQGTPAPAMADDPVTNAYKAILGRAPDPAGFAYYKATGETGPQVIQDLLASSEYASLHSNAGLTVH